ncbi:hypothetical protein Skr01_65530 [Sphaerisporangium krabiense]|uniref:Nitrous oxidase accessory protein NosD n=1 Tax=Sphaerisporangium krabiense TaxID=763782 RepID=A0A7W9DMZ1_9ACTN|nr:NosD domain-containing protein [Sphaerisporangium krabiense]MBB5624832.1 nitrous oxidase accessory protein NosD [Sphaerisporangium krabiense]GII66468.1 hypothetical protein Skr01_65530 [Sphaerisporangium krabiense]
MRPHHEIRAKASPRSARPAGWRTRGFLAFLLVALLGMTLGQVPANAATPGGDATDGGTAVAPPDPRTEPLPPMVPLPPRPTRLAPPPVGFGCGMLLVTSVKLEEDLVCTGDGIIIGANDITIDLNGHTISGPSEGINFGISSGLHTPENWSNTVIRDGRIEGFKYQIYLEQATGTRLVNLTNSGGGSYGSIYAFHSDLTITGSRSRCQIERTYMLDSPLTVDHCTLHGSHGMTRGNNFSISSTKLIDGGLVVGQSDNGVITKSVLDDFSVSVYAYSNGNRFHDNVFKNSDNALGLGDAARPTVVENNTFKDNSIAIYGSWFTGIVKNNEFIHNRTAGIYIFKAHPVASQITGNTFVRNGADPESVTDPNGNTVRGDIHIGWQDDPQPITLSGNSGKRTNGWFIWAPHDSVIDGGGNHGAPCGPAPYDRPTPGGGPTVTINPAVTCS